MIYNIKLNSSLPLPPKTAFNIYEGQRYWLGEVNAQLTLFTNVNGCPHLIYIYDT